MKFLYRMCCTLLGLTMSAAGLLLLLDPVTTGERLHCGPAPAIILSVLVLLAGVGTLCGLRRKVVSLTVLVLTLAGLVVCLLSGRVRLTGLCLILLPMALFLFVRSLREAPGRAPAWFEWTAVGVFALFALAIPVDALVNLPRLDFSSCKVGTDLLKNPLEIEMNAPAEEGAATIAFVQRKHERSRALLIADDHIVARTPAGRVDSPRFQQKLQEDPDRVMAAGILAGRIYAVCVAALLALLMAVCGIIRNKF